MPHWLLPKIKNMIDQNIANVVTQIQGESLEVTNAATSLKLEDMAAAMTGTTIRFDVNSSTGQPRQMYSNLYQLAYERDQLLNDVRKAMGIPIQSQFNEKNSLWQTLDRLTMVVDHLIKS